MLGELRERPRAGRRMATRQIIRIDEEKCTGCGHCIVACAEGALEIIDGKAKLIREIYCDGLGACLGDCPEGALTLEEREAEPFDECAVEQHLARSASDEPLPCGCPGSATQALAARGADSAHATPAASAAPTASAMSRLTHWPVQLRLVPPGAPFLRNADVLVCADCVPFAMPNLHERYLARRAVLVGCPKLDDARHVREKLEAIFAEADPKSITVLRMEVPCCGGLARLVAEARDAAVPECPLDVEVVKIEDGSVIR